LDAWTQMLSDLMHLFVLPVVSKGEIPAAAGGWEKIAAPPTEKAWVDQPSDFGLSKQMAMNSLAFASYKRRLRKSGSTVFV
jgi:hypothetical protein